jgi:hypothetical protein
MARQAIGLPGRRWKFLMPGLFCLALLAVAGPAGAQAREALMPLTDEELAELAADAEAAFCAPGQQSRPAAVAG